METLNYSIKMQSYWQIGSGKGSGNLSDASVLKDTNDLPYIPGKTLKGLFLDAARDAGADETTIKAVFGFENKQETSVIFESAHLHTNDRIHLKNNKALTSMLYEYKTFVRLDNHKQAEHGSLRTSEVCVPVTLHAAVRSLTEEQKEILKKWMPYIKHLGLQRNRGYGRCIVDKI